MKNDFEYNGFIAYYLPHPCLYGNYEVYKDNDFIGRAKNKKQVKQLCNETK